MKISPGNLTDYARERDAANDEQFSESSAPPEPDCEAKLLRRRDGWDPFEVWHTRIRRSSRDPHTG
ncbi:MAG TPA: hypothetical protein VMU67_02755 [Steroidobacteraceae bacterium]|nr:hypothetical protein [Steroidobacteraceae bacterium]